MQKNINTSVTSVKSAKSTNKKSVAKKYLQTDEKSAMQHSSMVNESSVLATPLVNNGLYNATIISGKSGRPEWKMTAVEKMNMVKEGVSKKKLETLKLKANLDYDKLSNMLSTTRATLINKKGAEHFSAALSERIVSIADVYSYGYEVFEDESNFNEWIFRPNQALGGKQPYELLDNQFGREEVKNVIGRIDFGVYS